jgi:Protein of unknown function (DUF551)
MDEWISVKDALPKSDKIHCLTFSPELEFPYRILTTNKGKFFSDITHWMFLPKTPFLKCSICGHAITEDRLEK